MSYLTLIEIMKSIFSILLVLIVFNAKAQTTNNTSIKKATGTVKIYNGNVSIGQVVVNQTLRPKLILTTYTQTKDTANTYKTVFTFSNPENMPFFNVNIGMKFSAPVIDVMQDFNGQPAVEQMLSEFKSTDMTIYQLKVGQISAPTFSIVIISKTKVFTTISGIEGIQGQ